MRVVVTGAGGFIGRYLTAVAARYVNAARYTLEVDFRDYVRDLTCSASGPRPDVRISRSRAMRHVAA